MIFGCSSSLSLTLFFSVVVYIGPKMLLRQRSYTKKSTTTSPRGPKVRNVFNKFNSCWSTRQSRDRGKAAVNVLSVDLQPENHIEHISGKSKITEQPRQVTSHCQSRTGEHKKSLKTLPPLLTGVMKSVFCGRMASHSCWITAPWQKSKQMLRQRLTRAGNEKIAAKYQALMTEYVSKGYAYKLSPEEAAKETYCTWYLPHQPSSSD